MPSRPNTTHPKPASQRQRARPRGKVAPVRCPHCGHALPPPVRASALEAARILARLPGGVGTSRDVYAAGLGASVSKASALLRAASAVGLVEGTGRARATGRGLAAREYQAVEAMVRAYETVEEVGA